MAQQEVLSQVYFEKVVLAALSQLYFLFRPDFLQGRFRISASVFIFRYFAFICDTNLCEMIERVMFCHCDYFERQIWLFLRINPVSEKRQLSKFKQQGCSVIYAAFKLLVKVEHNCTQKKPCKCLSLHTFRYVGSCIIIFFLFYVI